MGKSHLSLSAALDVPVVSRASSDSIRLVAAVRERCEFHRKPPSPNLNRPFFPEDERSKLRMGLKWTVKKTPSLCLTSTRHHAIGRWAHPDPPVVQLGYNSRVGTTPRALPTPVSCPRPPIWKTPLSLFLTPSLSWLRSETCVCVCVPLSRSPTFRSDFTAFKHVGKHLFPLC